MQFKGEIMGMVNDKMLPKMKSNHYVLLKDGRSFTSVSNGDDDMKVVLARLPVISSVFGFLFGVRNDSNAKRGFDYTGERVYFIIFVYLISIIQ